MFPDGSCFRPHRAVDEAPWLGGPGLLQPARGGGFDCSRSCYWVTRVAVPTGRPETEGHPIAAARSGVCFNGDDLAGLVGTFPRATAGRGLAELLSGA